MKPDIFFLILSLKKKIVTVLSIDEDQPYLSLFLLVLPFLFSFNKIISNIYGFISDEHLLFILLSNLLFNLSFIN
jgi:hypothetical protein